MTCNNKHIEITFAGERCPLCFLRTEVLLELAQPRAGDIALFCLEMLSLAMQWWPYEPE